jgi:hypothetical protein
MAFESNSLNGSMGRYDLVLGQVRKVSSPGPNSGIGHAKLTNNVAFRVSGKVCEKPVQGAGAQSVCNQHKAGQLRGCVGKVTSGGKLGHWLAIYWAVPRQGYGRN